MPGTRVAGSTPMPASSAGQRPEPSRSSASSSSSSATWIDVGASGGGRGREDAARAARDRRSRGRAAPGRSRGASGQSGVGLGALARGVRERVAGRDLARAEQLVEQHARQAGAADPGRGRRASCRRRRPPRCRARRRAAAAVAAGARAAGPAMSALRTRISAVAQANSPLPPGTPSAWPDSSRWQCALTRPGQQRRPRRAPRARRGTRRAARRAPPTASTVPSSASATAPSAIGGRAIGTTQRALTHSRTASPWPRRRPAARSACCGGGA